HRTAADPVTFRLAQRLAAGVARAEPLAGGGEADPDHAVRRLRRDLDPRLGELEPAPNTCTWRQAHAISRGRRALGAKRMEFLRCFSSLTRGRARRPAPVPQRRPSPVPA